MADRIVHGAAARYGAGDYAGTLRYVRENEHLLNDATRLPALLQAFYAARDAGLTDEARELATRIAAEDPDVPTIRAYLK
jgi:hypothetical protein